MLHVQVQIHYHLMKRVAFCLLGRTRTILDNFHYTCNTAIFSVEFYGRPDQMPFGNLPKHNR